MTITSAIRNFFINVTGYFIYKKSDLPIGIDFKSDLENKFGIIPTTVFDVGANYGQTALHYNKIFNEAEVYSFEPIKKSFLKLESETKHQKKIKCFHLALGEEKKEVEIFLYDESNSQLNSLKVVDDSKINKSLREAIKVDTLNNFVLENNIQIIDLLKIDTEGFELEVLKGAASLLENKQIKAILCEVALSKRNTRNTQLNDVTSFLDKYDYFFVGLYDTNVNYYNQGLAYSNALFILKNN